jgi:hypothetical protein
MPENDPARVGSRIPRSRFVSSRVALRRWTRRDRTCTVSKDVRDDAWSGIAAQL